MQYERAIDVTTIAVFCAGGVCRWYVMFTGVVPWNVDFFSQAIPAFSICLIRYGSEAVIIRNSLLHARITGTTDSLIVKQHHVIHGIQNNQRTIETALSSNSIKRIM